MSQHARSTLTWLLVPVAVIAALAAFAIIGLTGPSGYGAPSGPPSARPAVLGDGQPLATYLAKHYDAREERQP